MEKVHLFFLTFSSNGSSGNSRGGCRGCIPLDQTQYDMMNEGTEYLYLGSCRIPNPAEFQKTFSRGKVESISPKYLFRFSESIELPH
ncbi:hypothetical protein A3C67_01720 [Candidatus Nomurabacteria bacterium RIFCSPHIGHO2_02_FULL_42_19]|uniref:Uncharacterized protein n=1 Tax=Candidatus Nomurabacteria bacterium RIFCSPHIGHO2_02_FULL_42_19 TaxID=1801756 RepID=A0A1F6W3K4_9BACT|nr:MAG: hypothetical protein A3C67_01720 [Candidatus Nomurabacteria bacterium RIFCSPHIGHO2_02_FULL_42_19]